MHHFITDVPNKNIVKTNWKSARVWKSVVVLDLCSFMNIYRNKASYEYAGMCRKMHMHL